jgi:prepilin-type N-terminal cleavage/methylation domain-containing protein
MMLRHSNGFTLIEMTVSLMLLSFITIIGYQGLMFGLKQWHNGSDKMTFQYDYNQAESWIRNKLGSAELVKDPTGSDHAYLFRGEKNSLEFVSRFNRTSRGGLFVNKIFLNQDNHRIYVSYYLHHPEVHPDRENHVAQNVILLPDISAVSFLYFGSKNGKSSRWYAFWGDSSSLPQLVRMNIQTVNGEEYESTIHIATSSNA